jgi:hypothetical protein
LKRKDCDSGGDDYFLVFVLGERRAVDFLALVLLAFGDRFVVVLRVVFLVVFFAAISVAPLVAAPLLVKLRFPQGAAGKGKRRSFASSAAGAFNRLPQPSGCFAHVRSRVTVAHWSNFLRAPSS